MNNLMKKEGMEKPYNGQHYPVHLDYDLIGILKSSFSIHQFPQEEL